MKEIEKLWDEMKNRLEVYFPKVESVERDKAVVLIAPLKDMLVEKHDTLLETQALALEGMKKPTPDNSLAQFAQREFMGINAGLQQAADHLRAQKISE